MPSMRHLTHIVILCYIDVYIFILYYMESNREGRFVNNNPIPTVEKRERELAGSFFGLAEEVGDKIYPGLMTLFNNDMHVKNALMETSREIANIIFYRACDLLNISDKAREAALLESSHDGK